MFLPSLIAPCIASAKGVKVGAPPSSPPEIFPQLAAGPSSYFGHRGGRGKLNRLMLKTRKEGERSRGDCKAIPQSPKQHIWGQLNCLRRFASPLSFPLFDLFFGARRNEEGLFAAFFLRFRVSSQVHCEDTGVESMSCHVIRTQQPNPTAIHKF